MIAKKEIVLKYENNLPFLIFLIQNIILLAIIALVIFYIIDIKIHNEDNLKIIDYVFLLLLPYAAFQLVTYIKSIFSLEKLVIDENFVILNKQKYDIKNIGFRYLGNSIARSTMISGEIYLKDSDEILVTLIFNFWAGSLLSISPYTLNAIFNTEEKYEKEIINSKVVLPNLAQEKIDVKNFDKGYYILLLMFLIPALIFWFII